MRKLKKKLNIREVITSLPLLAASLNLKFDDTYLKNDLNTCHRCNNDLNFYKELTDDTGSIIVCISNNTSKLYSYVVCNKCTSEPNKRFSPYVGSMNVEIIEKPYIHFDSIFEL